MGDSCEYSEPVVIAIDINPDDEENLIAVVAGSPVTVSLLSSSRGDAGPLDFDATKIATALIRLEPDAAISAGV